MSRHGVVFDFDGVIALSEPVHIRAWEDLASEVGRRLPEGFAEMGLGFSDEGLCEILAAAWEGDFHRLELLDAKRRNYQKRAPLETTLVPGAPEAIAMLAESLPVAIATSSCEDDIRPVLKRYDLEGHFTAILTIESVTHPKPHPEIYLKSAAAIARKPSDCWVFEDSIHGATAARAAGARVIGMTTTLDAERLAPVHAAFPDYSDLESIRKLILDRDR